MFVEDHGDVFDRTRRSDEGFLFELGGDHLRLIQGNRFYRLRHIGPGLGFGFHCLIIFFGNSKHFVTAFAVNQMVADHVRAAYEIACRMFGGIFVFFTILDGAFYGFFGRRPPGTGMGPAPFVRLPHMFGQGEGLEMGEALVVLETLYRTFRRVAGYAVASSCLATAERDRAGNNETR